MTNWELIAKYLSGDATNSERKEVEQWLNSNPAHKNILANLKNAMRPGFSNEPDFNDTLEPDWLTLQDKMKPVNSTGGKQVRMLPVWIKIAASLLILLLAGVGSWQVIDSYKSVGQEIVALDSVKSTVLPDGSHVWLNRNARLTVSKDFGKTERNIALEGEGYFEVSKDKDRPFIITCGPIKTRVVGTAFNVKNDSTGSVRVTVTEGKVSVSNNDISSVFLIADEMALYDGDSGELGKQENTDLNFMAWKTKVVRFRDASLDEVCDYLNAYYHADIRLKNTSLQSQKVTTVFDHVKLEEALSILSLTLDLKVAHEGSVYYLSR